MIKWGKITVLDYVKKITLDEVMLRDQIMFDCFRVGAVRPGGVRSHPLWFILCSVGH